MEVEVRPSVQLEEATARVVSEIRGIDERYRWLAQRHLDSLTKPLGSLGRLEEVAAQYVAWREQEHTTIDRKVVYVFAGDHGITDEGVSAYPRAVTPQMVRNFLNGGAAINVLARQTNSDVVVVDVGVDAELEDAPGLLKRKVRHGTRNFAREAAMTVEEMNAAIQVGMHLTLEASAQERTLIALGEMGIGNTSSATAITAALTGESVFELTGRGTGLDDLRRSRKARIINDALGLHFGDYAFTKPGALEILQCVGGFEIAAIAGAILGAAARRLPVVIDGFICTAGAAIACAIAPNARFGIFAGHLSQEPGHRVLLESMDIAPVLQLDMRLGEGSGAVLTFPVIESAIRIYNEMATFASAGVSEASEA